MSAKVLGCEYSRYYEGGKCWCTYPKSVSVGHACPVWQKKLKWDKQGCIFIKKTGGVK